MTGEPLLPGAVILKESVSHWPYALPTQKIELFVLFKEVQSKIGYSISVRLLGVSAVNKAVMAGGVARVKV